MIIRQRIIHSGIRDNDNGKDRDQKASDHRHRSCTVGLFRSLGFWNLAPPMIVDGGCVTDHRSIRSIRGGIEAIRAAYMVLAGMLGLL